MRRLVIVLSLLLLASCGPKSSSTQLNLINSSIINGTDVKSGDLIASSIVGVFNANENFICTGSLIAPNIVMTAAHCAPKRASHVKIIFSNDIDYTMSSLEPDIIQEFVLPATDFKVGPTWDEEDETIEMNTGDIALIKFKGQLPAGFKPASMLSDESTLKKGSMVTVAGFGVSEVSKKQIDPRKYHNLEVAIEEGEVICEEKDNGKRGSCFKVEASGDGILRMTEAAISSIHETEIILDERKAGTCNGDSGGPAYVRINEELFLFGVTSRGSAFCDEVGIYTNALYYKSWIAETIKLLK